MITGPSLFEGLTGMTEINHCLPTLGEVVLDLVKTDSFLDLLLAGESSEYVNNIIGQLDKRWSSLNEMLTDTGRKILVDSKVSHLKRK